MPLDRDNAEEHVARIDMLLKELRLTAEEQSELAKQAKARARETVEQSREGIARARRIRAGKKH